MKQNKYKNSKVKTWRFILCRRWMSLKRTWWHVQTWSYCTGQSSSKVILVIFVILCNTMLSFIQNSSIILFIKLCVIILQYYFTFNQISYNKIVQCCVSSLILKRQIHILDFLNSIRCFTVPGVSYILDMSWGKIFKFWKIKLKIYNHIMIK